MNERSRELIGHIDVNPKVRELAEQSGCTIDKLGYGEGNLEKFAELIVRECVQVSRGADGLDATHEAWYLIKQHFGVE